MPYVPVNTFTVKDSINFCPPATMSIGTKNDVDSGFVNFIWFENGIKSNEKGSVYTSNFKSSTKLKLIKTSIKGNCAASDSVQLMASKNIYIPFQDSFRVCKNIHLNIGGDSIADTKIEWSSRLFPGIKREFNPMYAFTANDTFTVKVSSISGSCASQKKVYIYVEPSPTLYLARTQFHLCAEEYLTLQPVLNQGVEQRISYVWSPALNLDNALKKSCVFYSQKNGAFTYKLIATDTVFHCYDSAIVKIFNIEKPEQPVLGINARGAVIKNFDQKFTYRWYKNGLLKTQTTNDSQYVVSGSEEVYGNYKVIVLNKDSVECRDSSNTVTIEPIIHVKSNTILSVNTFPNPAEDKLTLEGIRGGFYEIVDYTGRIAMKGILNENKSIEIRELVDGLYFIHINFEGRTYRGSFIKK